MNDTTNRSTTGETDMETDQNEIITYWQREIERLTRQLSKDALYVADCFEKERTGVFDGDDYDHQEVYDHEVEYGFMLHTTVPDRRDQFQQIFADLKHASARLVECERIVSTGKHSDDVPFDDSPF